MSFTTLAKSPMDFLLTLAHRSLQGLPGVALIPGGIASIVAGAPRSSTDTWREGSLAGLEDPLYTSEASSAV